MRTASLAAAVGALASTLFITAPLLGWPPLVRVAPVLLLALLVMLISARPWSWSPSDWTAIAEWNPSARVVRWSALIAGLLVFWFVLTRFRSGDINAVDFTVYYERPNFQTLLGRPLFVESADDPLRAGRSLLAVHAHWIMLPLAMFYAIWPSPLWVLALSVLAIVCGAVYTLRIVQRTGAGGAIAVASAAAFIFNANTARTLMYGFHAEVLYAWFIPWMIHAGVQRKWSSFSVAAVLTVCVKEDAFLLLLAAAVGLVLFHGRTLNRIERFVLLPAPVVLALCNLAVYYAWVVPRLSADGMPFYANYWSNYGSTAVEAAIGMSRRPLDVIASTLHSAFLPRVIAPHAYLPLVGWSWFIGVLPIVLLYGASANEQLRAFGIYYAIPLVPFLVLAAADGARRLADRFGAHRGRARTVAAGVIVAGALVAGISDAGFSLRPWKTQVSRVPQVVRELDHQRVVLVQSALYPHAGYDGRIRLLTQETINNPEYTDALLLLAPGLSAYPLSPAEIESLAQRPAIYRRDGVIVVRGQTAW